MIDPRIRAAFPLLRTVVDASMVAKTPTLSNSEYLRATSMSSNTRKGIRRQTEIKPSIRTMYDN